jgi:transcriptional regulator with XRE-family HTH domain
MAKTELSSEQKKDYARNLFLHENLTQDEIALRTGVTRKTVSRWMEGGNWRGLKVSITITREEQIRKLYDQLAALNEAISSREKGDRYATAAEADTITKLAGAIEKMEKEVGIAEIAGVARGLLDFVRKMDVEKARDISYYLDAYIKSKL